MVRATVAWACAWEVSAGDSCDGHVGQQHRSKRGDYGGQSEVASSIERRGRRKIFFSPYRQRDGRGGEEQGEGNFWAPLGEQMYYGLNGSKLSGSYLQF